MLKNNNYLEINKKRVAKIAIITTKEIRAIIILK